MDCKFKTMLENFDQLFMHVMSMKIHKYLSFMKKQIKEL